MTSHNLPRCRADIRGGKKCGRPIGHNGHHDSEESVARKLAFRRNYAINHPDRIKAANDASRFTRYGITVEQGIALLAEGCGVCGSHNRLHIDHCHETRRVRGALCMPCNLRLGYAEQNPGVPLSLQEHVYLSTWREGAGEARLPPPCP